MPRGLTYISVAERLHLSRAYQIAADERNIIVIIVVLGWWLSSWLGSWGCRWLWRQLLSKQRSPFGL
jgi:hypothetical protein